MTEAEQRLARAQASDADWEARQSQEFDPARAQQAALDALAAIRENPVPFMVVRACHKEWAHPGNTNMVQRTIAEGWINLTAKAIKLAEEIEAKVEAEAAVPEDEPEST